ncbi:hypothetical protein [Maritalea sp.]|uniref:FliH/SctL family protein n=1 Tax=Maritalea sp. TaxID=2003361 RepID=UPI003EF359D5
MTQHAKFTFDLDLAKTSQKSKLMEERDIERMISQAREQGYNEGLQEGQNSVQSQTSQQVAAAAEQVAASGAQFLQVLDQAQQHHLAQSTKLAASVGHKLASTLIEQTPTPEISALIEDCLSSLGKTAHLVVRCNEQLSDEVKPIVEQFASQAGFEGRLIIMGEPDIGMGDCRVEWSDGGIARNFDNLAQEINGKITQFVSLTMPETAPIDLPQNEEIPTTIEASEEIQ